MSCRATGSFQMCEKFIIMIIIIIIMIIIIIIIIIPNPHFGAVTYIRILNFITSYDMVRDTGLDSKDGFA